MSIHRHFLEPHGLTVTVDRVVYHAEAQTPADRPHCFIYFITIHNRTDQSITIRGRKWVVTNQRGEVTAVEGAGVVGKTPTIVPGASFSYDSYHLLDTLSAVAEGSYLGVNEQGQGVIARIPKFKMEVPQKGTPGGRAFSTR